MSTAERDPALAALLDFLHGSRGFEIGSYKQASLERRFQRRMDALGCGGYGDYLDHLEVHPEEYEQLFDALLINVTEFFRDPAAWDRLRTDVLPGLLAAKGDRDPIRVWSAGCATGEEAYTIAIVLAESIGEEALLNRVKIYATDVDEPALAEARLATYTHERVEKVPADLRERYFEPAEGRMAFRKDLRRAVIFGRNNLVSDAPISRLDLLVCRNTLMYFNAEAQERILRHFHFALRENGALMLGKSEMLIAHRQLFEPIDMRTRIFRKREQPASLLARLNDLAADDRAAVPVPEDERLAGAAAFEAALSPQVVVSRAGVLTLANLAARSLFGLGRDHIGRSLTELELSHRPIELRATIEQVLQARRRVQLGEVRYKPQRGDERRLDVTVVPLTADDGAVPAVSVVFEDVSRFATMRRELEGNRRDLELAYEELQSTIDELETTNEELLSANEELQTTNEELQSSNEELETMNEELQSSNEDLETINDELRERTGELNNVNEFLEAILTSLGLGVAVVDRQQRVLVWNHRAQDLWGLRPEEAVEHHLLSLDIGLPVERLATPLRAVLGGASGRERTVLDAVTRRGCAIACSTTILPLIAPAGDGDVRGAIVLMEEAPAPG